MQEISNTGGKPRLLLFRWAGWFMLVNALLLMLISLRYLKSMPAPEAALAQAFLGLSYPGHFLSLALYLSPLVALGILAFPRRSFVFSLAIGLEVSLVLGVMIDSLVFAQYRFHLNGMVWNLLTSGAAGEVLPVTGKLWVVLCVAVLLMILVEVAMALACWRWVQLRRRHVGVAVGGCIFLVVLATHLLHAWADANNVTSITSQVRYLPAFKPLTMKRLLVKMGWAAEQKPGALKAQSGQAALKYPLEKLSFQGNQKPMNLVFIVLESWRYDTLTPEITPNIYAFSKDAWRFENHYSSGNCTRFGIFGLFYGLYGTYWHAALAEEKSPVLMQELQRRSYNIAAYGSAPLVNPEFDRTVFADIRNQIPKSTGGGDPVTNDRIVTQKMVDFLAHQDGKKPFFGFVFYDSPHAEAHPEGRTPFKPSLKDVNYLTLNNDTDPVPFFNKYKNSLNFVDDRVKEVLAVLAKKKLLDNTVVVITGDHAQEFNELKLNYWGHCGNFSKYQTQTPMIIHWPGKGHQVVDRLTSHLDLAPSLMQFMFGCTSDPASYSNGRYLWDTSPRPFVLVSSWDTFSINEPDRITVTEATGQVQILDQRYREIPGATVRPQSSKAAMEGMGRFFAR